MNRPVRNRFLQLLRNLCASPSTDPLAIDAARAEKRALNIRTPRLESLEGRRVMAANITQFAPTDTGFTVQFSEAVDTTKINLYTTSGGAMGAADVSVQGATTGAVKGSVVFTGTTMTFVASGGILPADTYTVTLRSAADGFTDAADGELLDGEKNTNFPSGNGTAGGNFVNTFTVGAGTGVSVGFADIARGPGQALQGPATGSGATLPEGLALQVTGAAGVTSLTVTFQYDSTLMNISEVQLGPDAPTGSQVQANLNTAGVVTLSFFALSPLTADQTDILEVIATVPESATYGKAQVLHISALEVNAGALAAKANDAIHVAAYPGDVNANRRYDAEDARLIARVGVGSDSGFVSATPTSSTVTTPLFPLIDPMLLGDVTGVDGISPLDASDVLRKVIGLSVPNLPNLPSQAPTNLALSATSVPSGSASGTTVGNFSTTDPDAGDTHTYTLVSGTGDTDNSSFTISGNQLKTAAVFNAATKSSYAIRVRTTDASGKSFERALTISVTAGNQAPTDLTLSATSIAESQTSGAIVGNLTSTDPDSGNTFTYSLVSGAGSTDNASFTINNNQLVLNTALNFENKSSYAIRVRTTDNAGGTFEKTLTISVTNVNEAPTLVSASATTVPASAAVGTTVGTLSTTDPDATDTHVYTLVSGTGDTDNAKFSITDNQLKTAATFSGQTSYSIRVRSTDAAGLTTEQVITGTIASGNAAPSDIALSTSAIAENSASGTTVGNLSSTDANATDTHTYALVAGTGDTDNAAFTITGNQLKLAVTPDFETKSSYSVRVQATDNGGLTFAKVMTVTITNVNEAPTVVAASATTVPASAAVGTTVGTLSTTDPDASDTHVYTLVSGTGDTDNAKFSITGNQLKTAATFSGQSSYSIRVRSTDAAGLTTEQVITGTIASGNVAPSDIALSTSTIAENSASGTTVGNLSSTDANATDTHTYALVAGTGDTDNAAFTITGNQLKLAVSPDFETKSSYSVRVQATDNGGLTFAKVMTVTITNVNEAPTVVATSATTVPADAVVGTTVGTLSTTDPDASDTHVYTLVSGTGDTDNAKFSITGNQLKTAATFSGQTSYSIRVRSTDAAGLTTEQVITGTIASGNVAPSDIALSTSTIAENSASGTTVGNLSSTDANATDTHTYALVAGTGDTDNAAFTISGNQLKLAVTPDFETKSSYSIRVQATDNGGLTFAKVMTVTITNVNEAPTVVAASATTVPADAVVGTTVGTLSTTDPDVSDTHVYTLVSGTGDTDNAKFSITDNQLKTAATFSGQTSYSIRVRSTDAAGLTTEQVITGTIASGNVAPSDIALSTSTIAENSASGTTVGNLSSTDANATDTHSYALVAGTGDTDNAAFTITGNQLKLAVTPDFETKSSYSIRVQATDNGGLTFAKVMTVTITNVNEAPTAAALTDTAILDGDAVGTVVGSLSASDPDASDSFTYALVSGDGSIDNGSFTIVGNELRTAFVANQATQSSYSIRVQAQDTGGLSFERTFTILVDSNNLAPTAIQLSSNTLAENGAVGTTVGNLTSTDPNAGDTHTYSLVSGQGDTDNALFQIVANELRTAANLDFETKPSYEVRVRSTDAGSLTFDSVLNISVTNVNESPDQLALSTTTVADGTASGQTAANITATDPDAGDTLIFSLASGAGDADNAEFTINGNQLILVNAVNRANKASYAIRLSATDVAGASTEQSLVLTVPELPSAPTGLNLSATQLAENQAAGTAVGQLTSTDANATDTHIYTLVPGAGDTDNAVFEIDGTQLRTTQAFDFESKPSYNVRIRTTDSSGLLFEQAFVVTVTNVNEAPTAVTISSNTIANLQPSGTIVGLLGSTDADADDTFVYTLVTGTGDTDNNDFQIVNGNLVINENVDSAIQSLYSVRVKSTDAAGAEFEQILQLLVS